MALVLIVGCAGLLAGCGSSSGIQVERHAHLPSDSAGARFVMLAAAGQEADPSYMRDAELVAAQLAGRNFVRVTDAAGARFAVMVRERSRDASQSEGTAIRQDSTSGSRGRSRGGMGIGMPGGGGGGMRRGGAPPTADTSSNSPRPTRGLDIDIYDITRPAGPGQRVFSASAQLTDNAAGRPGPASAELIAAALRDFPGREQERYSVPVTR